MVEDRTTAEIAVDMQGYLDRLPEAQGREYARAMIAAAGTYLQQHFGETVAIDTVASIMMQAVQIEMLQRHEISPAGRH